MLVGCAGLLGYTVFDVRVKNEQIVIMLMLLAFMIFRGQSGKGGEG